MFSIYGGFILLCTYRKRFRRRYQNTSRDITMFSKIILLIFKKFIFLILFIILSEIFDLQERSFALNVNNGQYHLIVGIRFSSK